MGITVVGLGPGDPGHLTREAWDVLESAEEIWLRTKQHPVVSDLPSHLILHSFDYLYEQAEDFSQVYEGIVGKVLDLGQRREGVVYAVPGHPLVGETTVEQIMSQAKQAGLELRLVEGLSFVGPTLTALGVDALTGLQVCDAIELVSLFHPLLMPDRSVLVGQLYGRSLAGDVKLTLMNQYPDDHEVKLVHAAGTLEQRVIALPLYELDRRDDLAHLTTLYIPPLVGVNSFEGLQNTVAHLRAPEGCPWDREQTHESLRSALLEEAYETVEAIDAADVQALQEELGDLLLQILLHAQIATEAAEFKMVQIIADIDTKLKYRHPHVWGERSVEGADNVLRNWEELKRQEKGREGSILEGVPVALPALQQADALSRRAVHVGFDWAELSAVVDKVQEEMRELEAARTLDEREAELGDLLFTLVNWARWMGLDAETALRKANARFSSRFRYMEQVACDREVDLTTMSTEQLETLWQEAKRHEANLQEVSV